MLIDVSKYQGSIDWKRVRAAGVDEAIIRCGVGKTGIDKMFKTNIDGAIVAGIRVGVYTYSKAKTEIDGRAEAKNTLDAIDAYKGKLYFPVFIDVEEPGTGSYSKQVISGFCKAINEGGFNAGIYCSSGWRSSYLKGVRADYWWIAKWGSSQPSDCCIWQYSEKGRIDGIGTTVDLNKNLSYHPQPTPAPTPTPKGDTVMIEMQVLEPLKSAGGDVRTAQRILRSLNYKGEDGKLIAVDGNYGKNSVYAMKAFQRGSGIKVDGWVGEETWNHLLH